MLNLFSKKKATTTLTARVLFHKEANGHVEHGVLQAEHAQLRVTKTDPVRFCFPDLDVPPAMTPEVLAYIFDQAERKGFVVHNLHSYATVSTLVPAPRLRPLDEQPKPALSQPRQANHQPQARTARRPAPDRDVKASA